MLSVPHWHEDRKVQAVVRPMMAQIGPAPVRDVLLSLLEGSRYDFAMLGSVQIRKKIDRLVLSPRMAGNAPVRPRQHGLLRMKRPAPNHVREDDD